MEPLAARSSAATRPSNSGAEEAPTASARTAPAAFFAAFGVATHEGHERSRNATDDRAERGARIGETRMLLCY